MRAIDVCNSECGEVRSLGKACTYRGLGAKQAWPMCREQTSRLTRLYRLFARSLYPVLSLDSRRDTSKPSADTLILFLL